MKAISCKSVQNENTSWQIQFTSENDQKPLNKPGPVCSRNSSSQVCSVCVVSTVSSKRDSTGSVGFDSSTSTADCSNVPALLSMTTSVDLVSVVLLVASSLPSIRICWTPTYFRSLNSATCSVITTNDGSSKDISWPSGRPSGGKSLASESGEWNLWISVVVFVVVMILWSTWKMGAAVKSSYKQSLNFKNYCLQELFW